MLNSYDPFKKAIRIMPSIFQHDIEVPRSAIDANSHVNNVSYVQWMQDAAVMHSSAQGLDAAAYRRLEASWVVRSHQITYLAPAFAGDTIEVRTWVANLKRSRSLRKFIFIRTGDAKVIARAQTEWVYVDAASGRPCSIPAEVSSAFPLVSPDEEP